VRERSDWEKSVYTVEPGFQALGAELEAVHSYTDANCTSCGSCIQGCPSNAGKSTMNTYIADALARGILELRANATVERVLTDGSEATGVEYVDAGERHAVRADAVVVAAGALNTPQLLIRSGIPNASIGRHLGLHPVRLVYGLFDEPQDAHMVYPITAHCVKFQHDEDGGYVIEATTIQDPVSFATTLGDENGPLWGPRLVEALSRFRYWNGFLAMANDDNNSVVGVGEDGRERLDVDFQPAERDRIDNALRFSREVLQAAGATQVCWTGLVSTHVQGGCRMGDDPARSVVDRHGESHEVKRLFVGDGSLVPRTLSVNPSLTIMALATRLAEHLDADPKGYLRSKPAAAVGQS
jgi:choline dehydrogenase-like flavoprotein